jgi:release factor glutamine methyltransferase
MRARTLIKEATATLKASPAIDHWQKHRERIEAEDLLAYVMGGEEPEPGASIPPRKTKEYRRLVERRATGEPIPYIRGTTEFRGIELLVTPGVFVPRHSSEFLAEQAVRRLRKRRDPVLVDLATGAGTIALAVADEVPDATVYGTDLSKEAIRLARRNAKHLGLHATFSVGDLFGALRRRLPGEVGGMTLHPPFVAEDEGDDLPEVRDWEPVHTLTDHSDDGLGIVRRAVEESPAWLRKNGWLLMETDPDRARDVKRVYEEGGFRDVASTKGGELKVTRVIVGRRPR